MEASEQEHYKWLVHLTDAVDSLTRAVTGIAEDSDRETIREELDEVRNELKRAQEYPRRSRRW